MSRSLVALAFAGCLLFPSAPANAAPDATERPVRSPANVTIERGGAENPVVEVARSTYWGAIAGFVLGGAITLLDDGHSLAPTRWGIAVGAFGGFGAGVYFVASRPVPSALLELHDFRLEPAPSLANWEPVPGGARVRVLSVRF